MIQFQNFLLTIAAAAQPQKPPEPSFFNPTFLIVMLVFIVGFIFLIDRPNRKRQQAKEKAVESMKKGDAVVSIGGIHGTVVRVNKEKGTVVVTVAKGVDMEFNKSAVNAFKEDDKAAAGEKSTA